MIDAERGTIGGNFSVVRVEALKSPKLTPTEPLQRPKLTSSALLPTTRSGFGGRLVLQDNFSSHNLEDDGSSCNLPRLLRMTTLQMTYHMVRLLILLGGTGCASRVVKPLLLCRGSSLSRVAETKFNIMRSKIGAKT